MPPKMRPSTEKMRAVIQRQRQIDRKMRRIRKMRERRKLAETRRLLNLVHKATQTPESFDADVPTFTSEDMVFETLVELFEDPE